jgi:hypothetical protein
MRFIGSKDTNGSRTCKQVPPRVSERITIQKAIEDSSTNASSPPVASLIEKQEVETRPPGAVFEEHAEMLSEWFHQENGMGDRLMFDICFSSDSTTNSNPHSYFSSSVPPCYLRTIEHWHRYSSTQARL